jgi:hypothetical protein
MMNTVKDAITVIIASSITVTVLIGKSNMAAKQAH